MVWVSCAILAFSIWAMIPSLRSHTFRVVTSLLSGRMIPIYSVETPQKRVAFSFDAVWGADQTKNLLSILRKHGVKTTFFLGGFWLEKYPEMVKLIAKEDHEIGNHTYTHPHLNSLAPEQIEDELMRTHQLIYSLTGKKARLFRPPFGEYSNKVIESAERCGYTTIIWDVDSLDWKNLGSDAMIQRVYNGVRPGSIVLFHNAGLNTPQSIDALLGRLQAEGYEIVPISQILIRGKTYNDHSGRQRPLVQPPLGDSAPKPKDDGRVG
jgi:polysaccharide deacetylase family sporulation protein PdaB